MSKYDKEYQRNWQRIKRARTRRWVSDYKQDKACCICGENHPRCLDFHHTGTEKKDTNISRLISTGQCYKVKKEVEKCIIVCANCHRKIHA